jgi:hypothetical protein
MCILKGGGRDRFAAVGGGALVQVRGVVVRGALRRWGDRVGACRRLGIVWLVLAVVCGRRSWMVVGCCGSGPFIGSGGRSLISARLFCARKSEYSEYSTATRIFHHLCTTCIPSDPTLFIQTFGRLQ